MGPLELLHYGIGFFHDSYGPPEFAIDVMRDVLGPPVSVQPEPDGIRVFSYRGQTEVFLTDNRTELRDYSGNIEERAANVAMILGELVQLRELASIETMAFSFAWEARTDDDEGAENWMGQTFLNSLLSEVVERKELPYCNNLSFLYPHEGTTIFCELFVPPNTRRLMIRIGVSEAIETPPPEDQLTANLQTHYDYCLEFLSKVGLA